MDNFDYLKREDSLKLYLLPTSAPAMQFYIQGIRCNKCVNKLEHGLLQKSDVQDARVHFGDRTLTVWKKSLNGFDEIARAIVELGYEPVPLRPDTDVQKIVLKENRMDLLRIGISGFAVGNIMLMAVMSYAGADEEFLGTFLNWLSLGLFIPVVTFSAWPLYKNVAQSLQAKKPSIDLPICLAIWIGGVVSFYNMLSGRGEVYFDSLTMLIFLILSSRFVLKRIQQRYLSLTRVGLLNESATVKRWNGADYDEVSLETLQPGDIIRVEKKQKIPVDGFLLSPWAQLNTAILTGESMPQAVAKGAHVYAGTVLISGSIDVKVKSWGKQSRIGQIFYQMEQTLSQRTPLLDFTDRVGRVFTFTVIGLAIGFFIIYAFVDPTEAVKRSLALIILACPCTLAFAIPLSQSLAMIKCARQGWFIKNAATFEKLLTIKNVFFDKTGTLTEGLLKVESWSPREPSSDERRLIKTLESKSQHPVARALLDHLDTDVALEDLTEFCEVLGRGVFGIWRGARYSIESATAKTPEGFGTSVGLYKDDRLQCVAHLSDQLRSTTATTLDRLRTQGFKCMILSGDSDEVVTHLGQKLGFGREQLYGRKSPEDKAWVITQNSPAAMVGDGVNDALAMAKAHVSVATYGCMEASLKAADVFLSEGGIHAIPQLFKVAEDSFSVVKRNLCFSLFYNSIGAMAALMGLVHPILAAILMPLSSVTVLTSALWGTNFLRTLPLNNAGANR